MTIYYSSRLMSASSDANPCYTYTYYIIVIQLKYIYIKELFRGKWNHVDTYENKSSSVYGSRFANLTKSYTPRLLFVFVSR
jgi:hypothetical protein